MPIFFLSAGNFPFTGWGDSYDLINNQHKRFLQVIYAKFQSTATCNRYFNEFHFTMSRSQGCVTSYEKDGLIEMGDSGGGVIHTVYINGIMSLHVPTIKNVFVYTKVWRYVRWIQETIEKY
ncbi:hypothetical protein HCN44_006827 [Aphidius gifuensis]|uniref:Peptidase S1 domain-containing protein n=2 Tax=Aphidius gifuensis TaxID=684658 RepID=A0A835CWQ6_APHGI|nr:hypothetical protein HCN44_006827 [Aphidius gifuensis]